MRTNSPTATPPPTAYDCVHVAVYIAGRRTNLVVADNQPEDFFEKQRNNSQ